MPTIHARNLRKKTAMRSLPLQVSLLEKYATWLAAAKNANALDDRCDLFSYTAPSVFLDVDVEDGRRIMYVLIQD